jgi:hypothetical protein
MNHQNLAEHAVDAEAIGASILVEKLIDALTPGLHVEFDPDEASAVGAFIEDALNEEDATLSSFDGDSSSHVNLELDWEGK